MVKSATARRGVATPKTVPQNHFHSNRHRTAQAARTNQELPSARVPSGSDQKQYFEVTLLADAVFD